MRTKRLAEMQAFFNAIQPAIGHYSMAAFRIDRLKGS
jgi:hypothetical protein